MVSTLLKTKHYLPRLRRALVARRHLRERLDRGAAGALIAALRMAVPGVGGGALALLASPSPPIDTVLAALLNELGALRRDIALVLDDYHAIAARDVQEGMASCTADCP